MALPAVTRTWIFSPNNRIVFVSINDTVAKYLFGIKTFLKANGYTVRSSSNGTATGTISDGIDRWTTSADAATYATSAVLPQSWMILRDGNGVDMLLSYNGATNDIFQVTCSPNQTFALAGTPTHMPTSTDSVIVNGGTTMVNATANTDRIWFGWVSNDAKNCRFAIARAGDWVGNAWGLENILVSAIVSPQTFDPPARMIYGFRCIPANAHISSGVVFGQSRLVVSGTPATVSVHLGMEFAINSPTAQQGAKPELQSSGFLFMPLSIASVTAGYRGKIGNLVDWWAGNTTAADGSTYGLKQFIAAPGSLIDGGVSGMWPWDGTTVPILF